MPEAVVTVNYVCHCADFHYTRSHPINFYAQLPSPRMDVSSHCRLSQRFRKRIQSCRSFMTCGTVWGGPEIFVVWDTGTELSNTETVPGKAGRWGFLYEVLLLAFCACRRRSDGVAAAAAAAAAALLCYRGPAIVLRLLLPGDFPMSQPLCYPRLDSVLHRTDLYTGILTHFTN